MAGFSHIVPHLNQVQTRELAEKGLRAIARVRNMAAQMEHQVAQGVQTLEVGFAAFAWAFARGRWSEPNKELAVFGVPMDLASGFAGHLLGFFGGSAIGRYARDVHNLSDGSIASYLTTLGLKMGLESRAKAQAAPGTTPTAATKGVGADHLSELMRRTASAI